MCNRLVLNSSVCNNVFPMMCTTDCLKQSISVQNHVIGVTVQEDHVKRRNLLDQGWGAIASKCESLHIQIGITICRYYCNYL